MPFGIFTSSSSRHFFCNLIVSHAIFGISQIIAEVLNNKKFAPLWIYKYEMNLQKEQFQVSVIELFLIGKPRQKNSNNFKIWIKNGQNYIMILLLTFIFFNGLGQSINTLNIKVVCRFVKDDNIRSREGEFCQSNSGLLTSR